MATHLAMDADRVMEWHKFTAEVGNISRAATARTYHSDRNPGHHNTVQRVDVSATTDRHSGKTTEKRDIYNSGKPGHLSRACAAKHYKFKNTISSKSSKDMSSRRWPKAKLICNLSRFSTCESVVTSNTWRATQLIKAMSQAKS